ncbi:MAG TPA: 50S ribosomal protein L21 [Actinomycetota bacterium]|jgi:large subunit ribosomal protein L21
MYAVIKTGGKQYRVAKGDVIEVEHLKHREGTATFTPILVVGDDGQTTYGTRDLKPYTVVAKVLGDAKGDKVTTFKYRSKSGYASKSGHRQLHTLIEIVSIGEEGAGSPTEPQAAAPAPTAEPEEPAADGSEGGAS